MSSFVRHLSLLGLVANVSVLAVGLLAFVGLLVQRFRRRGAARFWTAPGAIALCLLPLAVGTAFAVLLLRQVLAGMALTGAGGVAAIAAGSVEALLPILLGFGVFAALTACAFLMTAVGSATVDDSPSSGLAGWTLLAVSLIALVALGGLVWLFRSTLAMLNGPSLDPASLPQRLGTLLAGALGLVAVTLVLGATASVLAPRGPADLGMKLVSLAALAFCGVLSLAGLWATWSQSQSLMQTAATGLRDGELPEPAQVPVSEEASATPMPPPPPPARDSSEPSSRRSTHREDAEPAKPRGEQGPYRVGGAIREPKKIRNVSPVYPAIAKQARVQGTVILEATISPRGEVTSVTVLRGAPLLDQSAVDAVKQWVYSPTLLNGVPVPVIMTVTVTYKLSPP